VRPTEPIASSPTFTKARRRHGGQASSGCSELRHTTILVQIIHSGKASKHYPREVQVRRCVQPGKEPKAVMHRPWRSRVGGDPSSCAYTHMPAQMETSSSKSSLEACSASSRSNAGSTPLGASPRCRTVGSGRTRTKKMPGDNRPNLALFRRPEFPVFQVGDVRFRILPVFSRCKHADEAPSGPEYDDRPAHDHEDPTGSSHSPSRCGRRAHARRINGTVIPTMSKSNPRAAQRHARSSGGTLRMRSRPHPS